MLNSQPPNAESIPLVLIDQEWRVWTGSHLLERLRKIPARCDATIMMLTPRGRPATRRAASNSG